MAYELRESQTGRERLLDQAHALFMARGYAGVSMQEIAEAAGLSKAAPYHHFRDKEGLFLEIFRQEMHRLRAGVIAILDSETPFRTRLVEVVRWLLDSDHSQFSQLVADVDRHISPERKRAILATEPPPTEVVRPFFERAAREDFLSRTKADAAAAVFLAFVFGLLEVARHGEVFETGPALETADVGALVDVLLFGFSGIGHATWSCSDPAAAE